MKRTRISINNYTITSGKLFFKLNFILQSEWSCGFKYFTWIGIWNYRLSYGSFYTVFTYKTIIDYRLQRG